MARLEPVRVTLRDGAELWLRSAQPDDAEPLLAFLKAAASTTDQILTHPDEFPASVQEERAYIQSRLDQDRGVMMIALDGSTPVATLGLNQHPLRRQSHTAELGMMCDRAWRGRGLGRMMIERAITWAAAQPGLEKLCLCCFHTNAAGLSLYTSVGFIEEGRRLRQAVLTDDRGERRYVDEIMMGLWLG